MGNGTSIISTLQDALRATTMRQTAIANNIANLETPGYHRKDVPFEKHLAEAMDDSKPVDFDAIETTEPMTTPVGENGNNVSLDLEVGELIKNSAAQKTYLRLAGKLYKQMETAITTP